MISRDRVIRTLNHQPVDRVPRDLWLATGIEAARPDDVAEIEVRFPSDFLHVAAPAEAGANPSKRSKGIAHKDGKNTDPWGCVWRLDSPGSPAVLIGSPLTGAASLSTYQPPADLLDAARFDKVNASCEGTGRFTLGTAELRPLERLCQLRGADVALRELAEGNVELRELLDRLHDFYGEEAKQWAKTQVDGVVVGDDLTWAAGSQMNHVLWRSLILPLFRNFCAILREHDKFAFFLARGPLRDVLDDLIEVGIDAVYAQWPLDDFVRLASSRRGQIVFWGGLENKRIEPPAARRHSRGGPSRPQGRRFRRRRHHQPNHVERQRPAAEHHRLL